MASRSFFKTVRVTVLLLILFFVAMNSWLTRMRSTDWNDSLWVAIYPVNGDASDVSRAYINGLTPADFESVETFIADEAERYGIGVYKPVTVRVAPRVDSLPPAPPIQGSTLAIMLWSLKLRFWAYRNDAFDGPDPDVQLYLVYHDPAVSTHLRHSLGLQKGMIGVVNAFAAADMAERNNVIVAHEFLHTLGASDKYDPATSLPLYPDGYADPDSSPRYPQSHAEIMGGRVPLTDQEAVMPASLRLCRIGAATAREIRWLD